MPNPYSLPVLTALVDVATGGSGTDRSRPPVGVYRSGPQLERLLGGAGIDLKIGMSGRVGAVQRALHAANTPTGNIDAITSLIELVADPREYLDEPGALDAVVSYMNARLVGDGLELRRVGARFRLTSTGTAALVGPALTEKASHLDMASVLNDFEHALAEVDSNPAGAITSACSTVESVCKCILDEIGCGYPSKKDIAGLTKEVSRHLNLNVDRVDLPDDHGGDVRQMLQGLASVTSGIGALRTHVSDAHGRGMAVPAVDGSIARLAIHAASTVSLFFLETWQKKRPQQ